MKPWIVLLLGKPCASAKSYIVSIPHQKWLYAVLRVIPTMPFQGFYSDIYFAKPHLPHVWTQSNTKANTHHRFILQDLRTQVPLHDLSPNDTAFCDPCTKLVLKSYLTYIHSGIISDVSPQLLTSPIWLLFCYSDIFFCHFTWPNFWHRSGMPSDIKKGNFLAFDLRSTESWRSHLISDLPFLLTSCQTNFWHLTWNTLYVTISHMTAAIWNLQFVI